MSLFDDLKRAVGELAQNASRQTQVMKLQSQLGKTEGEIKENYAEAGRRIHDLYRSHQVSDSQLQVILERIEKLQKKQQRLRMQVQKLQSGGEGESGAASAQDTSNHSKQTAHPDGSGTQQAPQRTDKKGPRGQRSAEEDAPSTTTTSREGNSKDTRNSQETERPSAADNDRALCPQCGNTVSAADVFCNQCGHRLENGEDSS